MLKAAVCVSFLAITASARPDVIFDVDFESPPYTLGDVNGQDGWIGSAAVTTERAFSGSQSLETMSAYTTRLFEDGALLFAPPEAWWMEAHAYIESSASASLHQFSASSALGNAFFLEIDSAGEVVFNSGIQQAIFNLGADVLDQWLTLRIELAAPGQLKMSVVGANVNLVQQLAYNTPWNPPQLTVYSESTLDGPHAFWDDITAGNSPIPAPAGLAALGVGSCALERRRRRE